MSRLGRDLNSRIPQPVSTELVDDLMHFIQTKFYPGKAVDFAKDTPNLHRWVVFWPAGWFTRRGVTVLGTEYKRILTSILLDALRFQKAEKITYLPAYLKMVVQSHFKHHGDELYQSAKNIRTLAENVLLVAHKSPVAAPDPVREMAQAARLLKRPKKPVVKPSKNAQLNLL